MSTVSTTCEFSGSADHGLLTLSNDTTHEFFVDDNGQSLLERRKPARKSSLNTAHGHPIPLQRYDTWSSVATEATAVPRIGRIDLTLSELCDYIEEHSSLQQAKIISTECYCESAGTVTHRFLLLELRRDERKDVFLRLDRRRAERTSRFKFIIGSGSTKANDKALIASRKDILVGSGRFENQQHFVNPPMLHELGFLLRIVCEEIVKYKLWPENCWFFCSLIQQHLKGTQNGWFSHGSLQHASLAQNIRIRVTEKYQSTRNKLFSSNLIATLGALGDDVTTATAELAKTAIYFIRQWRSHIRATKSPSSELLNSLNTTLNNLSHQLFRSGDTLKAIFISEETASFQHVMMNLSLGSQDLNQLKSASALTLHLYARYLRALESENERGAAEDDKASKADEECASLLRQLRDIDQATYQQTLDSLLLQVDADLHPLAEWLFSQSIAPQSALHSLWTDVPRYDIPPSPSPTSSRKLKIEVESSVDPAIPLSSENDSRSHDEPQSSLSPLSPAASMSNSEQAAALSGESTSLVSREPGPGTSISIPVVEGKQTLMNWVGKNLFSTIHTEAQPFGGLITNAEELLDLFCADFGALVIGEGIKLLRSEQNAPDVLSIADYLRMKQFRNMQATQEIKKDLSDFNYGSVSKEIVGLLYVPLPSGGRDFMVFLRNTQEAEDTWTNPLISIPGGNSIAQSKVLTGKSREWTAEQLSNAEDLSSLYGQFIRIWSQKETDVKPFTELLANSSSEVRGPLDQIIRSLELALEDPLDPEIRENLKMSHSASKSLLYAMDDLLGIAVDEAFDFLRVINDTIHVYQTEAEQRGICFTISMTGIPNVVTGNMRKIRQIVRTLTANAVKYTEKGEIKVECSAQSLTQHQSLQSSESPPQVVVEIVVSDTGCGIDPIQLETILQEAEQVGSSATNVAVHLGVGLAAVARNVSHIGGQLRIDSTPDIGSRFACLIPLSLPQ